MKRRRTISPKTIATANTPRSLTERWVGNIMKRCWIIATILLQNNRKRMLLYQNLQKESQILKRFCKCSKICPSLFQAPRSSVMCRPTPHLTAPPGRVFAPFWSENRYNRVWFLRELRECMNVFIVSIPKWVRKKEKYTNSKWIWRIFFCLHSKFLAKGQVWKRVWILKV